MKLKKLLSVGLIAGLAWGFTGCKYDDDDVWDAINSQEQRIAALEQWQTTTNANIAALQAIVNSSDFIKSVTPITEGGKVIGYTISFLRQGDIAIYNGEKGETGAQGAQGAQGEKGDKGDPGEMPVIGVEQLADGLWYWTLNGQLLKDAQGNPICASGRDGKDGQNGTDGKDGQDGQNGTDGKDGQDGAPGKDGQNAPLPELKYGSALGKGYIADAVYLSVDGGKTWVKVSGDNGKDGQNGAPGQDGQPGTPGSSATSIFSKAPEDMGSYWLFTLANGTEIKVAKYDLLMLTASIDGGEATAITGGELEVPASKPFTIAYKVADPQSKVTVRLTDSNVSFTEKSGEVEFAGVAGGSKFTVLFILTDFYNQTRLYKVTVTTAEEDEPVIIDGETNEELADAISDALGLPRDENGDVTLTPEVIENTTSLNLSGKDLTDVSVLQVFTNLESLNVSDNDITEIDLSTLPSLKVLDVSNNPLTELDLSAQTELETLNCSNCFNQQPASRSISNGKLDLSEHKKLKVLDCSNNGLTQLSVSENSALSVLNCQSNKLSSLDLQNNPELTALWCGYNNIVKLDLTANTKLISLGCWDNQIEELVIATLVNLSSLQCSGNKLTKIDLSGNLNLNWLNISDNQLESIDLSKNAKLTDLAINYNSNISQLDLTNNSRLTRLGCSWLSITSLNVSNLLNLEQLICDQCLLKTLDITKCSNLNELSCGMQRKNGESGGNYQEMVLVLTEAQLEKWENEWKALWGNESVRVSDKPVSETGGKGSNFGNGGVF